jgi:hypothetical protein
MEILNNDPKSLYRKMDIKIEEGDRDAKRTHSKA